MSARPEVKIDIDLIPDALKHLVELDPTDYREKGHNIPSGRSMAKEKFKSLDDLTPVSTLNPDGKSRACRCGARYTSFPDHHMWWCDMRVWK